MPGFALNTGNETIPLADYRQTMDAHSDFWRRFEIEFIVLTKGIPIRITGADMGSCDEEPGAGKYSRPSVCR